MIFLELNAFYLSLLRFNSFQYLYKMNFHHHLSEQIKNKLKVCRLVMMMMMMMMMFFMEDIQVNCMWGLYMRGLMKCLKAIEENLKRKSRWREETIYKEILVIANQWEIATFHLRANYFASQSQNIEQISTR